MIVRKKIFLSKKRDFGDIFGTVFTLMRRNFGVLAGSILVVGGPFILVSVIAAVLIQSILGRKADFLNSLFRDGTQYLSDTLSMDIHWHLLTLFIALLPFAFVRATVANFFVVYERKNEGEEITINEIAKRAFRDGFRVYAGVVIFTLFWIIIFSIIGVPMFMLGTVANGAGIVLVVFILFFTFLAFGPQLMYIFSYATWFAMVRDKVFAFKAVGNVFKNIRGNFWWTWVLMIVMLLVVFLLSSIAGAPFMIYGIVSGFSRVSAGQFELSILYIVFLAITQIATQIIFSLVDLMTGVSYYAFEEERTGAGLARRIDEIGKNEESAELM